MFSGPICFKKPGHDQEKVQPISVTGYTGRSEKRHNKKAGHDQRNDKEVHVARRGSREERETIIHFDETDGPVTIYTFNADLKRRLKAFAKKYPELCRKTIEDTDFGSMTYELEKSRLSIRLTAPYSAERRRNAGECVKKNRPSKASDK